MLHPALLSILQSKAGAANDPRKFGTLRSRRLHFLKFLCYDMNLRDDYLMNGPDFAHERRVAILALYTVALLLVAPFKANTSSLQPSNSTFMPRLHLSAFLPAMTHATTIQATPKCPQTSMPPLLKLKATTMFPTNLSPTPSTCNTTLKATT